MPFVPISETIVGVVNGQVDSTTPQVSSTRQGANSVYLAHPTRNSDALSSLPTLVLFSNSGGSTSTSNQQSFLVDSPHSQNFKQSNSSSNLFNSTNNNDAYGTLVNVDPINQANCSPTSSSSSSDDEDGGDQDEESDSTESISTDESDNNHKSPVKHRTNSNYQIQKQNTQQQAKTLLPHEEDKAKIFLQPSKSDSNEQYSLIHEWPIGRPLPLPVWDEKPPEVIHFDSVLQYEEFAGLVELISQRTVAGHKYNTVDNFIRFYRAFKKSKIESLELFYRQYQSPLTPAHYSCVGLAYELITQINSILPANHPAINKFYITSCEEAIETTEEYVKNTPPDRDIVEKEHVSVCLKIQIGTNRNGCLLLDPGYHVTRPITIMEDNMYPHTGKFVQSDDGTNKKEYDYTLVTPEYVTWDVIDTKKGKVNCYSNLIFVSRPFLSALDCAERRNLVYDFKSVLKRNYKGQVTAGLYFPLTKTNTKTMTIFFMENNNRSNIRLNVSRNVKETREIQICEEQMGLSRGKLTQMMNTIGSIVHDESFLDETLRLNAEIVRISAEN